MRYGLAILVIAFLAVVGTVIVVSSNNDSDTSTATTRNTKIVDYENNDAAKVSWTQQGRLVGDDQRRAVRVTVTKSKRTVEILDFYAERVEKSDEFANSPEAFSAFVRALDT